jgi:hypothetical protein
VRRVAWWLVVLALLAAPAPAGAAPGLVGREVTLGDGLRATVSLWPGIFRPTSVQLQLDDGAGSVPTDVRRVDLQFAMVGMNHGARGLTLAEAEPGTYVGSEYLLSMEGPWWLAIRVERADGLVISARLPFDVAPERAGVSNMLYARPDRDVQVEDVAVHPHGIIPTGLAVRAGHPVRLEVIYVDEPPCGPSVRVDDPPAEAALTADGLAELTFVPTADGELSIHCTPSGLTLFPAA